jgi:two-component system, LuxR family, sensor histidine kinase DctS
MDSTPKLLSGNTRRVAWLLALPKVGVLLLVAAVLSLLWLLHLNEVEEDRSALIKDVLWLEQNLRFHLQGNEEKLQQLAADLGNQPDSEALFRLRAGNLARNHPDILSVLRLDARLQVTDGMPSAAITSRNDSENQRKRQNSYLMAARLGKSVYSEVVFDERQDALFELAVPVFNNGQFDGLLVSVYSLQGLLSQQVPWWFTEKHQIQVLDQNDQRLASKSNVQGEPTQTYEIPFEPPGYGLKLRVISHQSRSNPLQRILAGAIIVLAAGVFWSLWAVRDLMRQRSQAEEALRAEHAFRKAMEDSLTVGMRARDLNGTIIYVNSAFCRMTGFSSEELVGRAPPMPYWVPNQLEETFAMHRAVLAGEAPQDGFELMFMRKNGEHFHALIYEAPLIDGNGQQTGWMGSVLDITERKRTAELAQQQMEKLQFTSRLITMGEMASTLAHELNQPLAAIASYNTGCINLLDAGTADPADLRHALEKVGIQAQRAGRIIRRVHDFVRKSEPKLAPCQLADVIDDCLAFIEVDARKRQVRIDRFINPMPEIQGDRLMLEQVLLNLMRNGMEAMAETAEEMRFLSISAGLENKDVVLRVADNGCGISDKVREKLFTAFFSTKPEGMGVGLSICRSIVEFHRGRLSVDPNLDSPSGNGTIFTLTLPIEPT